MTDPCTPSPEAYPSDCELMEGYRDIARNRATAEQDLGRQSLLVRAAPVRLLLLDVDGVLTDGSIHYADEVSEGKTFNTQDGFGLRLLHEAGIDTGVITARSSAAVARRANDLRMRYVHQGTSNKLKVLKEIMAASGLKPFEIAYMGDDWLDLALLTRVGLAAAPANAVDEVKQIAHFVSEKVGGHGAVREVCILLLEAKGLKEQFLQRYMSL
jgi:3-deoxy-D-manno-octulosonate 8-phosphate phosphatase (KDO 8-P phosphatase)